MNAVLPNGEEEIIKDLGENFKNFFFNRDIKHFSAEKIKEGREDLINLICSQILYQKLKTSKKLGWKRSDCIS